MYEEVVKELVSLILPEVVVHDDFVPVVLATISTHSSFEVHEVWWIGEYHCRLFSIEELLECLFLCRGSTYQLVSDSSARESEYVAELDVGIDSSDISSVVVVLFESFVRFHESEVVESPLFEVVLIPLRLEHTHVPLSESDIVLDDELFLLFFGEVGRFDDWDFCESGFDARFESHISAEDYHVVIHDDWSYLQHLWEFLYALDEFLELRVFDGARVARVHFDFRDFGED